MVVPDRKLIAQVVLYGIVKALSLQNYSTCRNDRIVDLLLLCEARMSKQRHCVRLWATSAAEDIVSSVCTVGALQRQAIEGKGELL